MTENLKKEMLTPLIKRIFELSEEFDKTHYFGSNTEENRIAYIIKEL